MEYLELEECKLHFCQMSWENSGNFSGKCSGQFRDMSENCPGKVHAGHVGEMTGRCPGVFREITRKYTGCFRDMSREHSGNVQNVSWTCPGITREHSVNIRAVCLWSCFACYMYDCIKFFKGYVRLYI